jgi:hypothetical protein
MIPTTSTDARLVAEVLLDIAADPANTPNLALLSSIPIQVAMTDDGAARANIDAFLMGAVLACVALVSEEDRTAHVAAARDSLSALTDPRAP